MSNNGLKNIWLTDTTTWTQTKKLDDCNAEFKKKAKTEIYKLNWTQELKAI